ncbi:MAG: sugar phosphate nucleotidyltransferase [Pyrinomonadaceae bacterium]
MAIFSCEHEVTNNLCSSDQTIDKASDDRWAVILAGGDGTRLQSLTRSISGDDRPKQFCPIIGGRTLLDQTSRRVALSVAPERTLTVLTRTHKRFYRSLLRNVPKTRLLVQPENKGTAPALLFSLLHIAQLSPNATVAFFPSDHYFADDEQFMSHIESAFSAAQTHPETVTLLGIKPESPEVEYGWIEPDVSLFGRQPRGISRVRKFWEKPSALVARGLMERGCLWNSFVMVGRVDAFLKMTGRALPALFAFFSAIAPTFGTPGEARAMSELYSWIPSTNFSHEVLALRPDNLAVMQVSEVGWSDLGEPKRVFSTLQQIGLQTQWAMPAS